VFRLFVPVEEESLLARVETEKGGRELYLKVDIPKLRWRLRGSGLGEYAPWQQESREIWHGDLSKAEEAWLEFYLPPPAAAA
jgi:hypothetical protein